MQYLIKNGGKCVNRYLIVPGCSDLNRGDQALVWETKRIAEECGFTGKFYLTSEQNEPVIQSTTKGLEIVYPILEHPSRKFKSKENIKYTGTLKIKWGLVALFDLLNSILILANPTRKIVKKFSREEKTRVIEVMEQVDAVFMKGGGLLQTYGGLASTYSMYFWVYPLLLAHKLGKPVYIMPNSFGPFEGPFVKKIAKLALRKCKVVTTRETFSQKMLEDQLGISVGNYADLAFELPKSNIDRNALYRKFDLPNDRKIIALTMRPYRFPHSSNPEKAYLNFKHEMAEFIDWIYENGYMPVIVEHTLAVNAHENDGACIRDVVAMLDKNRYRIISDSTYNCEDLKCVYSFFQYIVGTRFHSMIFSFGSNVPGIAISYTGNKSTGIMHDMRLDEYVMDINDVTAESLKRKFTMLVNNEKEVRQKILNYRKFATESRVELKEKMKSEKGIL